MTDDATLHLALRTQLLTVTTLPTAREWENKDYTPNGEPYIAEEFVPATSDLTGSRVGGLIERTGLYVVKVFGLADTGITPIRTITSAILAAFPLGWAHAFDTSNTLRVRNELGPWAGQILPQDNGLAVCVVTVPWRYYGINA